MNDAERNIMTILTISRIVENCLAYCLPPQGPNGFSVEDRRSKGEAIVALTAEGTPFYANCLNNGELGDKLYENMSYFIDDVFGENGRIVSVDIHNNVQVEQSLIVDLFKQIVDLRLYLEAFLKSGLKFLRENEMLESDFEELVNLDMRYYHAFAGKISCQLLVDKFLELNENANSYAQSYSKAHGNIDPHKDPNFNPDDDPSVRMLKNEFHELNQAMVNVLNSYGEDDPELRYARDDVYAESEVFSGKRKPTDTKAYFKVYNSHFDKIIMKTQNELNNKYQAVASDLRQFEETRRAEIAAQKEKAEAQPEAVAKEASNGSDGE